MDGQIIIYKYIYIILLKNISHDEVIIYMDTFSKFTHLIVKNDISNLILEIPCLGLTVGVYDLLECKSVTSLTCEITGEMDATNLNIVGVSNCCLRNTEKVSVHICNISRYSRYISSSSYCNTNALRTTNNDIY